MLNSRTRPELWRTKRVLSGGATPGAVVSVLILPTSSPVQGVAVPQKSDFVGRFP
jgi:hypothetical protein